MTFFPRVDEEGHVSAEQMLVELCRAKGVSIEDVEHYYDNEEERLRLSQDFSEAALQVRSKPDKWVNTNPPRQVDLKSTQRKDTGNIAIELSAYYFALLRYQSLFGHVINGTLRFFSPASNKPHSIFIQPLHRDNVFFQKVARVLVQWAIPKRVNVYYRDTGGSKDPFVLIKENELNFVSLW